MRALVLAELITGSALLAILVVCGNWLIGRGLAPLDGMASKAGQITSSGDLAARMPDPGDHRETGRLAGAINTMLDRIQQAFGARQRSEQKVRQFAADASHELRTPLTTIRGYAELYRQGALGPGELPNAMRRIEQEADRMSMLVAELLELARLDRDSSLDLTETDLAALAATPSPTRAPWSRTARSAPKCRHAWWYRRRVPDPPGACEPARQRPRTHAAGNGRGRPGVCGRGGAVLEVADAGPGMSEQDAARAFDRFHRGARGGGADDRPPVSRAGPGHRQRPRAVHRAGDRGRARRVRPAAGRPRHRDHRPAVDPGRFRPAAGRRRPPPPPYR